MSLAPASQNPDVTIHLPRPHPGQMKVIASAKKRNVLCCGRRFGKTVVGEIKGCEPVIEGFPVGWYVPNYKYVEDAWLDFKRILAPITARTSEQQHRLFTVTGGVLDLHSLENIDAGRGRKYKRVVVDEASLVQKLDVAWQQSIRPTLTDFRGDAWFLGTPKGKRNYFFDLFQRGNPESDTYDPDWASFQMSTYENPFIPKDEIDAAREDGELVFAQEYLAEFVEIEEQAYVPVEAWDHCFDGNLEALQAGDRTPIVIALDAAVSHDTFAVVAVSRHPDPLRHADPAIRSVKVFKPPPGGQIDFARIDNWLRWIIQGGCPQGHWLDQPQEERGDCDDCARGVKLPGLNVIKVVYDPYQLHDMGQRLRRDKIVWCSEFSQHGARLEADSDLKRFILQGRLAHNGDEELRQHVMNAGGKMDTEQARQVRIIKLQFGRPIDAVVAASMAIHECLRLYV